MPRFSSRSLKELATCHPDLERLFRAVIVHRDCTIIEGHRGEQRQEQLLNMGRSRVPWPKGKHNAVPSRAVDVVPYVNGAPSFHLDHCKVFGGYVQGVADQLGIRIRWGGDWDMDGESITDQTFQDLCHFELVE